MAFPEAIVVLDVVDFTTVHTGEVPIGTLLTKEYTPVACLIQMEHTWM